MRHLARYLLIAVELLLHSGAAAQEETDGFWHDYLEMWAEHYEQEQIPDDVMELLQGLRESPINLNDTADEALLQLPFVSPQQAAALKAYIEQTGLLHSLAELRMVNGFDSVTRRLMAPFVSAQPVTREKVPALKEMLTQGHHNLVMGAGRTVELAEGYLDSSYLGDPYRCYLRYYYKYKDNLHLQFSADQDAGEPWAWNRRQRGFDFYGFHLMLRNMGRLKSAIVGRYQLQFGQGLTLWSGFSPWSDFVSATWRYGQGIRPASAFCEYDMLQGAAATVALAPHWEATAFFSYVNRDATLSTDTAADGTPLIRSIYASGYHRTALEQGKKEQLTEQLYGANLHYRREHLSAGLTAYRVTYSREIQPYPYAYNYYAFSGKENFSAGADVSWRLNRWVLFGEAALSQNGGAAQLAGVQFAMNGNNHFSMLWRNYGQRYQNRYATAFGQSSGVQNESGLFLTYSTVLPWGVDAVASADFFRWPGLRYQLYSSSTGTEYRLRLSKAFVSRHSITLQYSYKDKGRNVYTLPTYVTEQTEKQQLQVIWRYGAGEHWSFATRLAYADFRGELTDGQQAGDRQYGLLLLQDVSCAFPRGDGPGVSAARGALHVEVMCALYALDNASYETSPLAYYGKGAGERLARY